MALPWNTASCLSGVRWGQGLLLVKVVPVPHKESNPSFDRKSHGSDETMAVTFTASPLRIECGGSMQRMTARGLRFFSYPKLAY